MNPLGRDPHATEARGAPPFARVASLPWHRGALALALCFLACGGKSSAGDPLVEGGQGKSSAGGVGGTGSSTGGLGGLAGFVGMNGGAAAMQPPMQPAGGYAGNSGQGGDGAGGDGAGGAKVGASGGSDPPPDPSHECKNHIPANCESQADCFCQPCLTEATNCLADAGCVEIFRCAADNSCVDLEDCNAPCDAVLRQYPNSVPIAKGLNDCARRDGCTAFCQDPSLHDAGRPPIERD